MIKIHKRLCGGGGGKVSAPAPPPAPAAAAAPVVEDTGPDPEMQAELEKQRAQRYQAGKLGQTTEDIGSGTALSDEEKAKTKETSTGSGATILGV